MQQFPFILILIGVVLVVVGLLWFVVSKYIPLGNLPGDVSYEGKNFKFSAPLATSLILSLLLTLAFWIWRMVRE